MELNSGNIDCIWNGFTINGREDDYTWSDPYLNNELSYGDPLPIPELRHWQIWQGRML